MTNSSYGGPPAPPPGPAGPYDPYGQPQPPYPPNSPHPPNGPYQPNSPYPANYPYSPDPQYAQYAPYGQAPPQPPRTNGLAIASLIFGIIGGIPLSVIFGIVALVQIRRRGDRGRGLAVAGLVLSSLWILFVAAVVVIAILTSPQRDATGTITDGGSMLSTQIRAGDCVNGIADGVVVTAVKGVPCAQPHDAEVILQFDLPVSAWPGREAAGDTAADQCDRRLGRLLADSPMLDRLQSFVLYPPDEASWRRSRSVSCMVIDASRGKLTGAVPRS
ncbi:DUF4190 domain-containing protein [Microbispora sp. NPDC049125]|uniref:DUF4190 domain-containing protein n=1 Tax=Microbispora sp. NPDC049125 TaxID=3154929 RepID=UPI003466181F